MQKSDLALLQESFPKLTFDITECKKPTETDLNAFRRRHHDCSCLVDSSQQIIIALIIRNQDTLTELTFPNLKALEYLNLSDNKNLTELTFEIALPELFHLDCSDSKIKTLTVPPGFEKLDRIDISRNQLKKILFEGSLPTLNMLDLSGNRMKNWDISSLDYFPVLEYLYLWGNPLNESVTVYQKGEDGANNLPGLKILKQAYDKDEVIKNDEYKVLIVGDGKAGKTCFVTRLMDNKFCGDVWDSTHGISVKQFTNEGAIHRFDYILNLWDFGGQDLYHNTHGLFMQTNTIYLLFWSQETEENAYVERKEGRRVRHWKNRKLKYWLRYIAHLGGKSPVLVVQTSSPVNNKRKTHREQQEFEELYGDYFDELFFLDIDVQLDNPKENGLKKLMSRMEEAIDTLEREDWLPLHWVKIREELEKMKPNDRAKTSGEFLAKGDKTLDYDAFIQMAKEKGEDHPERLLKNWLVKTGVVFYKEGLFDNKIILNQEWAIKAIYTLFDRNQDGFYHDIKDNNGLFDQKILDECWFDNSTEEKELFLSFMMSCEMCFEIEQEETEEIKGRQFIAIEMLPTKRPPGFSILEEEWAKHEEILYLKYKHSFFYYGIIQSFIARTYAFAEVRNIYKNGVLIKNGDVSAIIEAHENPEEMNGEILISIPKKGIEVLFKIQKEFEQIHIQDVKQEVSLDGKIFVDMEKLKEKHEEKQIVAVDGSIVEADGFGIFQKKEGHLSLSLSEDLKKGTDKRGSLDTEEYPKEESNIIEVKMAEPARRFTPFKEIEEKIKILFLSATPGDAKQINTGKESRFKDLFRYFDKENRFEEVKEEHGVDSEKFQNFLVFEDPHIFHYGGHGESEGIVLEDENLEGEILAEILENSDKVQCVILNACYSLPIAKKVAKYIPYVVATQGAINDETAIAFAQGFYMGIVAGRTIEKAFKNGITTIKRKKLPHANIPILIRGVSK